jgi:hypothetical protein
MPWLQFWTTLGVRNNWTKKMGPKDSATWIYNYLEEETNYLKRVDLLKEFKKQFDEVRFCEDIVLKHPEGKGKYLFSMSKFIPIIPRIYSSLRLRAVFTRLPKKYENVMPLKN